MTENRTLSRRLQRVVGGILLMVLALSVFSRIAGGSAPMRVSEGPAQLEGVTVRYALPGGEYVQRTFVSSVEARWKILSGPRQGDQGTEAITLKPVAPGIFFVNRIDPISGETVSEVYNLATLTISIYITRPNPEDPLRRMEKFGDGRLEIVSVSDGTGRSEPAAELHPRLT